MTKVDSNELYATESLTYLGSLVADNNDICKEVKKCLVSANEAYIWTGKALQAQITTNDCYTKSSLSRSLCIVHFVYCFIVYGL